MRGTLACMMLGIAILGLACSASKQPVDDVLVEGDGIRITKKDFDQYLAQVPPFAREQYSDEKLLEFYIKGELAYMDALRLGLDREAKVRKSIDLAVKQLLQKEYTRREINEKMGIADAQVQQYYDLHKDEFRAPPQRKCWHILTRTREDAERARQAVLGGEDFRDVATRFSIDDETREQGGRIGIFSKEEAPAPLKTRSAVLESLFVLAPGNVSGVIESDIGFHVLKADPAKRMPYLPVESVAKRIREQLLVPDSLVQSHYDSHRDAYHIDDRVQVRVIVVATRADAERMRERVLSGEDMAALARELSIDSRSSYRGGLLDWLRRGSAKPGIEPALDSALWDVPAGEMGPVVKTTRGFEVFRVEKRDYAGVQPLEEVRDRIRSQLLVDAREQAMERAFQALRDKYRVTVATPGKKATLRTAVDAGATGETPGRESMNEEELFSLASSHTDPAQRLEIYREIAVRFPGGERADDSQFMIGFVLMDELHDTAAAVGAYGDLLERFPSSDWADDARAMLDMMGGSHVTPPSPAADAGTKATNAGDPTR